jgi:hypothetical protein
VVAFYDDSVAAPTAAPVAYPTYPIVTGIPVTDIPTADIQFNFDDAAPTTAPVAYPVDTLTEEDPVTYWTNDDRDTTTDPQ